MIAIDLQTSHEEMPDGSHKLTLEVSGLPSLAWAQTVSDWLRDLIRANAAQIGILGVPPPPAPTSVEKGGLPQ